MATSARAVADVGRADQDLAEACNRYPNIEVNYEIVNEARLRLATRGDDRAMGESWMMGSPGR